MSIDTIDTLHAQHDKSEEWDHDLLISTILEMLKGPFRDSNYKSLTVDQMREEIHNYLIVLTDTKYQRRAKRLLKRVNLLDDTKSIILLLGDVIAGD